MKTERCTKVRGKWMKELQVMPGVEHSGRRSGQNASKRKRQRQRKRRLRRLRARLLRAAVVVLMVILLFLIVRGGVFLVQKIMGNTSESEEGLLGAGLLEIFGESGPVVVLDAGHGGNDQGTSAGKLLEKDLNLKVAKLVEKKLKKEGVHVLMTRTDDSRVELAERAGFANEKGAVLFVSIHCNYCEDSADVQGVECYYEEGSDSGQALAEQFSRGFDGLAEVTNRGVKSNDFHVLRETKMPAVLIELGYLSNASEKEKLERKDYQELLAKCIAQTIAESEMLTGNSANAERE